MPRYKIETTVQVRRVYEIEAPDEDTAEAMSCEGHESEQLVHEEDLNEEIDDVTEIVEARSSGDLLDAEHE